VPFTHMLPVDCLEDCFRWRVALAGMMRAA
jgi:hypothetical protein